jgi:Alpha galactosidase C-terminal beta sandwich domain
MKIAVYQSPDNGNVHVSLPLCVPMLGGVSSVWVKDLGGGRYYVALFNLNAFPSPVAIHLSTLGFINAMGVRDIWNHIDLGSYNAGFSLPANTAIPVQLQAGSNTIQFGNPTGYAPALDRIAIAPTP